ncbi:MAG: hypothetical protein LBO20_10345 [Bifidobacteriaceae bacterium]|nr:hypothetical protein [Bifidobacteriaceae bacterium]
MDEPVGSHTRFEDKRVTVIIDLTSVRNQANDRQACSVEADGGSALV